jgi:hypothetical protein
MSQAINGRSMFRLNVPQAAAQTMFGYMRGDNFIATCDPDAPIYFGAAVSARLPHGAFVVGFAKTEEPDTADHVCVEIIGEEHACWYDFPRSSVIKIVGIQSRATAA